MPHTPCKVYAERNAETNKLLVAESDEVTKLKAELNSLAANMTNTSAPSDSQVAELRERAASTKLENEELCERVAAAETRVAELLSINPQLFEMNELARMLKAGEINLDEEALIAAQYTQKKDGTNEEVRQ